MIKNLLWRNYFWLLCLVGFIGLATVRSPPIYGKIDFYLLNGRPWWPAWKALVANTRASVKTPVYTDNITGYILGGVFNDVLLLDVVSNRRPTLYIEDMEKNELPEKHLLNKLLTQEDLAKDFKCVINLIGYSSSWVPEETRHWHRRVGNTSQFYKFRDLHEKSDLRLRLKHFPLQKCAVYAPEGNKE